MQSVANVVISGNRTGQTEDVVEEPPRGCWDARSRDGTVLNVLPLPQASANSRPRGYAYQALAVAAAATVANIRRIVTFIANAAKKTLTPKQLRARRRTDEHGNRLLHTAPEPPRRT